MESRIINIPHVEDQRGCLNFIESDDIVPFDIKRMFYMYEVPCGAMRGDHAHKKHEQFIIAMGGSLRVELDDGKNVEECGLFSPAYGLYVPPMTWTRVYFNGPTSQVCTVLTSGHYEEDDYIRDYDEFVRMAKDD